MRDVNILSYVGSALWALAPEKWAEMLPALIRHARGDRLTAEELSAFLEARTGAPARPSGKNVAVIPIMGTIAHRMGSLEESSGGTSTAKINRAIDLAAADESIGTIIYHYDTPGGTVVGLQETADRMFALRESGKQQIAFVEGQCCSAGYWLAAQADSIVAVPHSHVGSIGVFSAHQDVSEMLEINAALKAQVAYQADSDALMVVGSCNVDGGLAVETTLDWLAARNGHELLKRSVIVLNDAYRCANSKFLTHVTHTLGSRVHAVKTIPWDAHLRDAATLDFAALRRRTQLALIDLAAELAGGFPTAGALTE